MNSELLNPLNSLTLYKYTNFLSYLITLYNEKKFPKVSLITGPKGIGKFTTVNHFINYIFDKESYDKNNQMIDPNSQVFKQIINQTFPNVIFLSGDDNKVKVDDIRLLKSILNKSTINNKPRFIIFDDVEKFNINSLNALLKIIEEPSNNNFFILINNQERKLLETIKSRCLETSIFLKNEDRIDVIKQIIRSNELVETLDYLTSNITPGNFVRFNKICNDHDVLNNNNYEAQIDLLIKLYKKHKNNIFLQLAIYLTNNHFYFMSKKNSKKINELNEKKVKIIKNINDLTIYNLSLYSVTNTINKLLNNEQ